MNVVLIEVDQMAADCLSCLGNQNLKTPNLDRLAKTGVRFEDATCQSPICLPSRISMLAGQYVTSTRQFGFTGICDRRMPWLFEHLKSNGYNVGAVGKFHIMSLGLERWNVDFAAPTIPEDYPMSVPKGNNYMEYCKRNNVPFPTDQMHAHNPFGGTFEPMLPNRSPVDKPDYFRQCCQSDVPQEHSLETYTTNQAMNFINAQDGITPFFLWLTYDRPHFPSALPAEWFADINPDAVDLKELPSAESLRNIPRSIFQHYQTGASIFNWGESDFRFVLATYYRLIEFIDAEIGRFLEYLDKSQFKDETIVIFTSDHGDEAGFNGCYNKFRRAVSEAVTRIPLIIRLPAKIQNKRPAGAVCRQPVEMVDLAPTICSLTGLPIMNGNEGRDLKPYLLGKAELPEDRPVFCEEYHSRMIRKNGWKLIFDRQDDRECQLYNMREDPNQFLNHYAEHKFQDIRIELKRELLSFAVQRIHGGYTEGDVERMRRGLDSDDPLLPEHTTLSVRNAVHCCRCACFIEERRHKLFVPFYNADMLLFKMSGDAVKDMYSTSNNAISWDAGVAELLIDIAIRDMLNKTATVSLLLPSYPGGEPPCDEEIREMLDKLSLKNKKRNS